MRLRPESVPAICLLTCTLLAACGPAPETVITLSRPTWFEDGWSYFDVSLDGRFALFGARFGMRLVDLSADRADPHSYSSLGAARAAGGPAAAIAWGGEPVAGLTVPEAAVSRLSPDRSRLAFFVPGASQIVAGLRDAPRPYDLDGPITGFGWVPKGDLLYVVVLHPDGLSSIDRLNLETGAVQPVREHLDAPPRFNPLGVSSDGRTLYLALASDSVPNPTDRHRPEADRDCDIYALDLATGRVRPVVRESGDDFYPIIANGFLYWTHNDFKDQIVVLPTAGGDAHVAVEDGQIPYWSPDGRRLAYTYGGWRIADWALNLDAAVVSVNDSGRAVSPPKAIASGYHEDFTPAWSPNGAWIAYHSHRSPLPVPSYDTPGHADDIFLRRPDAPMSREIRLTDWGWEVGMADWSPDGRRLVFDSWERDGPPGIARPWIVTIDTATGRLIDQRRFPLPRAIRGTRLSSWSPRGNEIAVIAQQEAGRQALWVLSVDGKAARRLLEFESGTYGGLDWTPDGESLVYAAMTAGRLQLFRLARTGGSPAQLTHDGANLAHPQVSPDGRWIAATRMAHEKALRRIRL